MSGNSNSGRKNETIERIKTLECQIANISTEALIDLAKTKVFNQIRMLGNSKKSLKSTVALALPVLLKSIKDRKEIEVTTPKPLLSAIRGEVSEPEIKLIDEELTVKAVDALRDSVAQDILPDTNATQYNAIKDLATANEPQHTTPPLKEPVINE